MKRQRVVAAFEKSQRYLGIEYNRAVVRVHVSVPVVTAAECAEIRWREWGVKDARLGRWRDGGQVVDHSTRIG